jgi:hypothetical protein
MERRAFPRCEAVNNQSSLEFAVPAGKRRIEARLMNISRNGALLLAQTSGPYETHTWFRLECPVKTDWVEATIVRVALDRAIALTFPMGCPDDLLLASTMGIDLTSMFSSGSFASSACD